MVIVNTYPFYCCLQKSLPRVISHQNVQLPASNLFSPYLYIQPANCHKFRWFGIVWLSPFAQCINYGPIPRNKIRPQYLLFSHCSPFISRFSEDINGKTLVYCSSSMAPVSIAKVFVKLWQESTKIHVFVCTRSHSQPHTPFSFTFFGW